MSLKKRKDDSLANKLWMSISANALGLIVSVVLTLIVPKALGVEAYGYWQLYAFYTSYVFLFHFGWVDGVLLRLGGANYEDLDYAKEKPLFSLFCLVELVATLICCALSLTFGGDRTFVLFCAACNILLVNVRYYILYVFQATSRVRDYSRYMKMDRYIYFVGTIILLLAGYRNYHLLLIVDLAAKVITVVGCLVSSRELFPVPASKTYRGILSDAFTDINAGIKLTIAYLAGILITGIVRFGIEWRWGVEAFGSISLVISISNMLVTFVSAIGVVLYPILRRLKPASYHSVQKDVGTVVRTLTFALLALYVPMETLISAWLPSYAETLSSMMLVFPICVFECQVSLVTNTFLKALRQERQIMVTNIVALVVSGAGTILSIAAFENVKLAMLTITVASAARCISAEIMLGQDLRCPAYLDCLLEIVLVSVFVITNLFLSELHSFSIYAVVFATYLVASRKGMLGSFERVFRKIRSVS